MAGREASEAWGRPGQATYGTLGHKPHAQPMQEAEGGLFLPGKRRRLNWVGLLLSFVIPPLVFFFEISILCSEYRYHNPQRALELAGLGPVALWALSVLWCNSRVTDDREPMWIGFQVLSCLLALVAGAMSGLWLYDRYMLAFYDLISLNEYPDVNPAEIAGDAILDAGFIGFSDGSQLHSEMLSSYRSGDTYCVVPIVNANVNDTMATYDFWAVGKNCCSDPLGVFRCGEYRNPHAQSGLRVVDSVDRDGYLLAVKQAEAKFGVTARYPVFVTWCQNPLKFAFELEEDGTRSAHIMISVALVANAFLLVVALGFFSRIGRF
jgi:hypothetical protein